MLTFIPDPPCSLLPQSLENASFKKRHFKPRRKLAAKNQEMHRDITIKVPVSRRSIFKSNDRLIRCNGLSNDPLLLPSVRPYKTFQNRKNPIGQIGATSMQSSAALQRPGSLLRFSYVTSSHNNQTQPQYLAKKTWRSSNVKSTAAQTV